jgi:hypothetical protein
MQGANNCSFKPLYNTREKKGGGDRWQALGAIYAENGAKRPFAVKYGAFMGLFGVLYVFAVARLPLWGEKRGFKGGLLVWVVSLLVFGALKGF